MTASDRAALRRLRDRAVRSRVVLPGDARGDGSRAERPAGFCLPPSTGRAIRPLPGLETYDGSRA